jgi:hypothetical protein
MTTDADLSAATAEAEQAQRDFLDLEHKSLHEAPGGRPAPAEVIAAAKAAELAQRRVEVVQQRVLDAKEDARLNGLHAIGAEVDQLAATAGTPNAEVVAALRQIADGAAVVRGHADAHDDTVVELYGRAAALYGDPRHDPVKRTGQHGPWTPHMPPMGVRHGNALVHIIGGSADLAITAAAGGDVDSATAQFCGAKDLTPAPPTAYIGDTIGQFPVTAIHGRPGGSVMQGVRDGRFAILSPDEAEAWKTRQGTQ